MATESSVQLPQDASPANKNLIRMVQVTETGGSVLQEVVALADSDGKLLGLAGGRVGVVDEEAKALLAEIRDLLTQAVGLLGG